MMEPSPFDFWYAIQNTRILQLPRNDLETFGTTRIQYHLLSETLDAANQIRVREGTLNAAKPLILTPDHFKNQQADGFEEQETNRFLDWLKTHQPHLRFLQYGFTISKTEVSDVVLHEPLEAVAERVMETVRQKDRPDTAVLLGVEQPWEVSLFKMMVDLVERSAPGHVSALQERNLIPNPNLAAQEVEAEFRMAEQDAGRVPYLYKVLHRHGVFERHQDRFFAIVRHHQGEN